MTCCVFKTSIKAVSMAKVKHHIAGSAASLKMNVPTPCQSVSGNGFWKEDGHWEFTRTGQRLHQRSRNKKEWTLNNVRTQPRVAAFKFIAFYKLILLLLLESQMEKNETRLLSLYKM